LINPPVAIPASTIKAITTQAANSGTSTQSTQVFSLATGGELQTPVIPLNVTNVTNSSNARTIAYALSTLPDNYLSLIPADYLSYLNQVGATNLDAGSGGSSGGGSGNSQSLAAVDTYYSSTYPTPYSQGDFTASSLNASNLSYFNNTITSTLLIPYYNSFQIVPLTTLQTPGPLGVYTISLPVPGISSGFSMNCATGGISCGYNAGGNILSHVVSLNYNLSTLSNTYVLSYTYGGQGTSVSQQTVTLGGSASATFSQLTGSGPVINLPVDPTQTQLKMLATFLKNGPSLEGIFNTNVIIPIGNNTSISLRSINYSGSARCASSPCQ
jgi:hypothetical protein